MYFCTPETKRRGESCRGYVHKIDILDKEYISLNVRESSGSPEKDK